MLTYELPEAPEKLYYSAGDAHPLDKLETDKIIQMVIDLDVANSDSEHYVTGWMGLNSVVVVRNYQNKRGTANGFVVNKGDRYRLSIQSIEFRIPKAVLWMSFRRKPRTMELITYETLGEQPSGMQQYRNILDEDLLQQLDADWRELNDYLGAACWQLENGTPLWQQAQQQITSDAIRQLADAAIFRTKSLQADGDYAGFWAGEYFFAVRQPTASHPLPAIQISWREDEKEIGSYQFDLINDEAGEPTLSLCIRPRKGADSYLLNRFDAHHLQRAIAMFAMIQRHLLA
ncbi:hypothetical protein [Yersinia mollaretii]|uniref:Uncharacterized protein n=1 Tax=Yersinia mollaretii (strain ATCC 43969 / DSM 18520 / CIP 103324 / CNY 7263 / WAIP 204) TaxID=349967 RepID=A0ABP2E950_YERMW|nr:hypothetical protein [Yersinia mollaretii]EEQ08992.1 hypothetical protein ymoll0001_27930 [Yersinia mollaretii ATCC 43969]MDN0109254.1 hypothetical protein [Yersinia mollaretii]QKJ05025.1 hypothetical protein HRD69_19665 [Yersinia mollaretii ATCC 43969]